MPITSNIKQVTRKITRYARGMPDGVGAMLEDEAQKVSREAKSRTPVDTGKLKNSHFVEDAVIRRGKIVVEVGAGDKEAWYASIVHEIPGHPAYKFVENPLTEQIDDINRQIDRFIERDSKRKGL